MAPGLWVDNLAIEDHRLTEFANAIGSLYATLYDERPVAVESSVDDGALICRLQGGLTAGDLMMLQHGHTAELASYREAFFKAVSAQLEMAVTAYTGHDVLTQEASFDPSTVITTLRFTLSPAEHDEAEQRAALRNWSRQVRNNARRLRALHVDARTEQHNLTERLRKEREVREEAPGRETRDRPVDPEA